MKVPEKYRVTYGIMSSSKTDGNNGVFIIPVGYDEPGVKYYQVIASNGLGWEHVSVVLLNESRNPSKVMPTWEDMCALKDWFWDEMDCVVQYHPPKSEHINNHQYCLHLWRPTEAVLPIPDKYMVGIPGIEIH